MKIIPFTEAQDNLETVLDRVIDDADYTVITRQHSENAVVMSLDTFNGLMETLHLLQSPANAAHLERSIQEHRQGKVQEHELDPEIE
jgi:antitoxin YefM